MKRTLIVCIVMLACSILAAGQTPAINYTYDSAGRLTGIDYGNGTTIAYTYDNAGNLLSRSVTTPPPASNAAKAQGPATPDDRRNSKPRNKKTSPIGRARRELILTGAKRVSGDF